MKRCAYLLLLLAGCAPTYSSECRKCEWLEDGPKCVRIIENGVVWMVSRGAYRGHKEITWEAEPHCVKCGHTLSSGETPNEECNYCGAEVICDRRTRGEVIAKAKDLPELPMIELWKSRR